LLLEIYVRLFSIPESKLQAIQLQAPAFLIVNQRPDLPKEGLLQTSDIEILRALFDTEDSVEAFVDQPYFNAALNLALNPNYNYLKSVLVLHKYRNPFFFVFGAV